MKSTRQHRAKNLPYEMDRGRLIFLFLKVSFKSLINCNVYILLEMNFQQGQVLPHRPPDRYTILRILDNQYPGIAQLGVEEGKFSTQKLAQLAHFHQYALPRYLMKEKILLFETELMNFYLSSILGETRQTKSMCSQQVPSINLPNLEETQQQENLDNEHIVCDPEKEPSESQNTKTDDPIGQDRSEIIKYSLNQITSFVNNFDFQSSQANISNTLIGSVQQLQKCKKQSVIIQLPKKQTKKPFQKQLQLKRIKSDIELKKNDSISVILGDKIPLQTKLMRNEIKKMAQNSFAVVSQTNQSTLSEVKKQKSNIVLILNKIADDNLNQLETQLRSLIRKKQLAEYCVEKLTEKCIIEPQTIPFMGTLISSLTKMKIKHFDENFQIPNKKNLNPFQLLVVNRVQYRFENILSSVSILESRREYLVICKLIGGLIKLKVLSKRVFNLVVENVVHTLRIAIVKGAPLISEMVIEGCIVMLEALENKFSYIMERSSDKKIENIVSYVKQFPNSSTPLPIPSFIDFLSQIDKIYITHTERIKCLLLNMKTRQQNKQPEKKSIKTNDLKQKITQILSASHEDKQQKMIELKKTHESFAVMNEFLKQVYEGCKNKIESNIQLIKNVFPQCQEHKAIFKSAFHQVYDHLVIDQCEFPFLASAVAILLCFYSQDPEKILIKPQNEQDLEQYEYFNEKLVKKLQYYAEASHTELIR